MNEDIPKGDYLSCIGNLFQLVWRRFAQLPQGLADYLELPFNR